MTRPLRIDIPPRESTWSSRGAVAIAWCFVAIQFLDLNLGAVGSFDITAQKALAGIVIPAGILFMGRIEFPTPLVVVFGSLTLAFVVGPVLDGTTMASLPEILLSAFLGFFAACALFTAMRDTRGTESFFRAWQILSVATGTLCILQLLGAAPLINVPADAQLLRLTDAGLTRATGLKFDPNFQAIVLLIGLVTTRVTATRFRTVSSVLITLGIVATLSRMGLLIAFAIILLTATTASSRRRSPTERAIGFLGMVLVVTLSGYLAYQAMPPLIQGYADARFKDLTVAASSLVNGDQVSASTSSSGSSRAELARAAIEISYQNIWTGVGGGNLPESIYHHSGIQNSAHNTYLELLAVGGLFGLMTIVGYIGYVIHHMRREVEQSRNYIARRAIVVTCGVVALLITFVYVSFFWLALIVAILPDDLPDEM